MDFKNVIATTKTGFSATDSKELNDENLDMIVGGTFTPNKFDERIYNQAGLTTKYHFICKDEFFIKDRNGKLVSITYNQANQAVRMWQKMNHKQPTFEDVLKFVDD